MRAVRRPEVGTLPLAGESRAFWPALPAPV